MTPLSPKDEAEAGEIQSLPLAVGTPVQFVKLDGNTGQPMLLGPNIHGGFVHAAVGTKGYVYNPNNEKHVADDLPGNVVYTAKTSKIKHVELRDGSYFLTTESGSIYQVVLIAGEPMLAAVKNPVTTPDASDHSVAGHAVGTVEGDRWAWLKAIGRALRGD